jgi:hypothetical protein
MNKCIKMIFGTNPQPPLSSSMRAKHMEHIQCFILERLHLDNEVTPGKINASGKLIKKPNWEYGKLTYEPNPDAMVHEIAHLILAPNNMGLAEYDNEMRRQFGEVNSKYGYMKQKRSLYETIPMGLEQKLRRRMGLPPSQKHVKVDKNTPIRTAVETGEPIAVRLLNAAGQGRDLIRLSQNLNAAALTRLEQFDNGEIEFCAINGWTERQDINAKINRRARLKGIKI